MEERLLIVGAGGLGREVLFWAQESLATAGNTWRIGGFLDARTDALNSFDINLPVLGDPERYTPEPGDRFAMGIGDPLAKLKLAEQLVARGGQTATIIHPTAIIGPRSQIGAGAVLSPYAVVSVDATVGDNVLLYAHATVDHDAMVGDGCTICAHCDVTGGCRLGRGVFMGSHATVLPGVTVGDHAVIGAGSVVVRDVPAGQTVIGVPAKAM